MSRNTFIGNEALVHNLMVEGVSQTFPEGLITYAEHAANSVQAAETASEPLRRDIAQILSIDHQS
jgi:hypothetical protein